MTMSPCATRTLDTASGFVPVNVRHFARHRWRTHCVFPRLDSALRHDEEMGCMRTPATGRTMRAARIVAPRKLVVEELPIVEPAPGRVRIRIRGTGPKYRATGIGRGTPRSVTEGPYRALHVGVAVRAILANHDGLGKVHATANRRYGCILAAGGWSDDAPRTVAAGGRELGPLAQASVLEVVCDRARDKRKRIHQRGDAECDGGR